MDKVVRVFETFSPFIKICIIILSRVFLVYNDTMTFIFRVVSMYIHSNKVSFLSPYTFLNSKRGTCQFGQECERGCRGTGKTMAVFCNFSHYDMCTSSL